MSDSPAAVGATPSSAAASRVRQGTPEWLAARRTLITATDVPVLLGISPWKSEADLAAEKYGDAGEIETNLRMRVGSALEPLIAEEYTRLTGRKVRRCHGLVRSNRIAWAAASPDFRVVGERRLVETKWTGTRSRFGDELPDDVAAQVQWQLLCTDLRTADVAALVGGDELHVYEVRRDDDLVDHLVAIAADFRRRLDAGGPFAHSKDSVKRAYPADDGEVLEADVDLADAVRALWALRGERKALEEREDVLETAIKTRMGTATALVGPDFRVTWKRTADRREVDYRGLAELLLSRVPETERAALVGEFEAVREGFRPFRVSFGKERE